MALPDQYYVVKFIVILYCSFSLLLTCHAAVNKYYFSENVQKYFPPHFEFPPPFESRLLYSFSDRGRNKEDIGKLTTSLLHDIHIQAGKGLNILLSPLSIWMILAMLLEGSSGKTEQELKSKLYLSYGSQEEKKQIIRNRFKELNSIGKNSPLRFESLNFVVSSKAQPINPEYEKIIGEFYNGRHFELERGENERLSYIINMWASKTTKNRIRTVVSPAVLSDLLLMMGNAVYFKSEWKYPFHPSQTFFLPFKDEFETPIKNVPMMNQVLMLPYAYSWQLDSEILQIPYADDTTSMIVILPREKVPLIKVLSKMRNLDLDNIIPKNFTEELVQLSLPRFQIDFKIYLNDFLKQDLGSMFSSRDAEFPLIGKNIFVSKVFHKAKIENTEKGTTASAESSVQFAYKSSGIMFRVNRPFIYLITEMKTKTVLFAGTYSNPFIG